MNEIRPRGYRARATSIKQAAARRRCALAVSEALERRCLLSSTWYTVSGTGDDAGSQTGGNGSQSTPFVYTTLRGAITAAVADGGTDTIGFDSSFNTAKTITLSSMLPIITDNLTITGPGKDLLTISGDANNSGTNNAGDVRIFFINQGTVNISNMTLANGRGQGGTGSSGGMGAGGAIFINGLYSGSQVTTDVTVTDVAFTNNVAVGGTGGSFGSGEAGGGFGGSSTGGGGGGFAGDTSGNGGGGFSGSASNNTGGSGAGSPLGGIAAASGGAGATSADGFAGSAGASGGGVGGGGGGGGNGGSDQAPYEYGGNGGKGGDGGIGGGGGAGGAGGFALTELYGTGGDGGNGGDFGGGGKGGSGGGPGIDVGNGGTGGFGGGGGAGAGARPGGNGGFGGGSGFGQTAGTAGFGAGAGGFENGGGGAGLGGAIFIRSGSLRLVNDSFSNNNATGGSTGGSDAHAGQGIAGAIFAVTGSLASQAGITTAPAVGLDGVTFTGNTTSTSNSDTYGISTAVTSVSSTSPDGVYGAGQQISITVSFLGAVNVTGTPQLALNTGSPAYYSSGTGTPTLTFTYTVGPNQHIGALDYASTTALSLNGGMITDELGNAAVLTLPAPGAAGSLSANTQSNIIIETAALPTSTSAAAATTTYSAGNQTVALHAGITGTAGPISTGTVTFTIFNGTTQVGSAATSGTVSGGMATANYTLPGGTPTGQYTIRAVYSGSLDAPDPRELSSDSSQELTVTEVPSLVVNTTSDVVNAFDNLTSLREAIAYANTLSTPSTITFSPTVFPANTLTTITLGGTQLEISNTTAKVTINGNGAVAVSGNETSQVFQLDAVTAELDGLTITGGNPNGGPGASLPGVGGGIVSDGATVTMNNDIVTNNGEQSGGPTGGGGGIFQVGGSLTLNNCTISSNQASEGGGIMSRDANVQMNNSTVSNNYAADRAGGLFCFSDGDVSSTIVDSTITGNSSPSGAAITNYPLLRESNSTLNLQDCTIAGNIGSSAIVNEPGHDGVATITYQGSIFSNPSGNFSNSSGVLASLGHNLLSDASGNNVPSDLINANPLLAPLGNYGGPTQTMPPLPGSPAIGVGATIAGVMADQRGVARPATGVDIGAVQTSGYTITAAALAQTQSATVATGFILPLQVTVAPINPNDPVSGGVVKYTAPGSGASATLSSGTATIAANGTASVSATANTVAGAYSVTASTVGAPAAATFNLTNTPGAPASITPVSGSGQSTTVNTNFATPLVVLVTDSFGNAVSNTLVTLAGPGGGASASTSQAITSSNGQAILIAKANTVAGSYSVSVSFSGAQTPATFNLTNTPGAPASIAPLSGSGQSTTVNTAFANPLVVIVEDVFGNAVPNTTVTVAGPGTGASASALPAITSSNGRASLTVTANTVVGSYNVTVAFSGAQTPATFGLTNTPGTAASVSVVSGSNQSAGLGAAFASPLVAVVRDAFGNAVPNVSVTFSAPASGASATITGSPATTFANGQASVTATANGIAGAFNVNASVAGVLTPATFSLQTIAVPGSGTMVVNNVLDIVGSNTNDNVQVQHYGQSNTGATGVTVQGMLNGANINKNFSQTIAAIYFYGFNGNDTFNMEASLMVPANVFAGNGTDHITLAGGNNVVMEADTAASGQANVQAGNGNNTITVGSGANDQVQVGNGNNTIVAGAGQQAHVQFGTGNNTVTAGDGTQDQVQENGNSTTAVDIVSVGNGMQDQVNLGDGMNTVTVGNGNQDQVHVGNGNGTSMVNNIVTVGSGTNDQITAGTGNNVLVEGNGSMDTINAGNGDNLIVGGTGQHNLQAGNGSNILIDGSVTLLQSGDTLASVLRAWITGGKSAAAAIRTRLQVMPYNTANANQLHAGSGVDWFLFTDKNDQVNSKLGDLLN